MKLPYSLIFPNGGLGEDAEIDACGITNSCMRFFMSVISFPHTFWDDSGEQVILSDAERQLLESGTAVLSSLECPQPMLVMNLSPSFQQEFSASAWTDVRLESGSISAAHFSADQLGQSWNVVKDGLYQFVTSVRINGSLTANGDFIHYHRLIFNGAVVPRTDGRTRLGNGWDTLNIVLFRNLTVGNYFNFQYYPLSFSTVQFHIGVTGMQVYYHG